jgi:hypothetical protein
MEKVLKPQVKILNLCFPETSCCGEWRGEIDRGREKALSGLGEKRTGEGGGGKTLLRSGMPQEAGLTDELCVESEGQEELWLEHLGNLLRWGNLDRKNVYVCVCVCVCVCV